MSFGASYYLDRWFWEWVSSLIHVCDTGLTQWMLLACGVLKLKRSDDECVEDFLEAVIDDEELPSGSVLSDDSGDDGEHDEEEGVVAEEESGEQNLAEDACGKENVVVIVLVIMEMSQVHAQGELYQSGTPFLRS